MVTTVADRREAAAIACEGNAMPITPAMIHAARRAMVAALDLTADDEVLVIRDPLCGSCGEAFAAAAREVGCRVRTFGLPADGRPLTAMPEGMVRELAGATVVINVMAGASDEVPFRIHWIQAIERKRAIRLGHAPGITEAMMTGGPLDVNYEAMAARERALLDLLAGAQQLHLTTTAGTDLTVVVADRTFVSDLHATSEKGVNLPCGEVYCAPVEDGADGTLVIDGPFGGDGNPPAPVRLTIERGRVTRVDCDDAPCRARVEGYMAYDDNAAVIGELGIGLNPGARLVGNMLEDEKALRTAHIAFGSNEGMPGGRNPSRMHIDYLFHRPTITATRADGSTRRILVDGDLEA
jgi:leucyl aminopeptidase (aminopeptidase T)